MILQCLNNLFNSLDSSLTNGIAFSCNLSVSFNMSSSPGFIMKIASGLPPTYLDTVSTFSRILSKLPAYLPPMITKWHLAGTANPF